MCPMKSLIIDTSGPSGFIASAEAGVIVELYLLPQGRELSKALFTHLAHLVNQKFEFVAVGVGPGSFTGTRIGASCARALANAWNIPLAPFSSTLLPDYNAIARQTYQMDKSAKQIELVYISPTT
jgi:tRNA threonylcarbamoyladenosine biosynthesis protein TsaB